MSSSRPLLRRAIQEPPVVGAVPAFVLVLAMGAALTGCRDATDAEPESDGPGSPAVRQLDEIPIGQLRVTLKGYPGDWRSDTDQSRGIAEPPRNKPLPENPAGVDLVSPDQFTIGDRPVDEVLASRQSRREFSGESLDLEELSFLLWCTQGVTHVSLDGEGQVAQSFRAAPSAGGRYPIETYLAVSRVAGVPNGLYRYLPDHHQLLLVRADESVDERIRAACYGQPFVGGAAAVFIWAAVPYRTEWKYGYLSHRMIAMEAGHVCQNLYLAAEAIDLGACALLSYDQGKVDALLGVDGEEEFAIYLGVVGKIGKTDD